MALASWPQAQDLPIYFGDAGSPAVLHKVGVQGFAALEAVPAVLPKVAGHAGAVLHNTAQP